MGCAATSRLVLLCPLLVALSLPARAAQVHLVERALQPPIAGGGSDAFLNEQAWKLAAIDGLASLVIGEFVTARAIGREATTGAGTTLAVAAGAIPLVTVGVPWGATILAKDGELGWNLFAESAMWSVLVRAAFAGLGIWTGSKVWLFAGAAVGAAAEAVSLYRAADAL